VRQFVAVDGLICINDIEAAHFRAVDVRGVAMAMAGQVALRFPVVGWLVRDAIYGRPEAKYYFLANCILAAALGAVVFGYAFVISLAVVAAWVALALLIYMTAADSFSKANRRALAADKKRRPAL
jgi:hypothetical protein